MDTNNYKIEWGKIKKCWKDAVGTSYNKYGKIKINGGIIGLNINKI